MWVTLPASDGVGADDGVKRRNILADVLGRATLVPDTDALRCGELVQIVSIMEGVEALKKLAVARGETIVELVAAGGKD